MSNNDKIVTRIHGRPLMPPFSLLTIVDYPPGCGETRAHKHGFFQALIGISGEFKLWDARGQGVVIREGDFLVIPPEWRHSWRIDTGCLALQVGFSPMLTEDYGELFSLFGDISSEWRMIHLGKDTLDVFMRKIEGEFDSAKPAVGLMLHSYLTELFATAMRAASSAPPERGNEMAVIRRTLDYVSRHYRERITVRELAAKSFISESRLFQIFRKHSGEPPLKHALKLRMEKAKTLLAISNMSVSQIADYLGYESVHYFSRAYKKHYKAPPSAERNGV